MNKQIPEQIPVSIAPWLNVNDGIMAVKFYKRAFDVIETYRLEMPDGGLVVRLKTGNAEFWVSSDPAYHQQVSGEGGGPIRMILTVPDPDKVFRNAIKAGATEIFPVGESHGWRLGRIADPFGFHWEIGKQTDPA